MTVPLFGPSSAGRKKPMAESTCATPGNFANRRAKDFSAASSRTGSVFGSETAIALDSRVEKLARI